MSVGVIASHGGSVSAYAAAVLGTSGLQALYRLGDPSGTVMTDSSGNGRDGTYVGSPGLAATGLLTGDSDTAVDFLSAGKYGRVPNASWMNPAAFTVSGVLKPTGTLAGVYRAIVSRDGTSRGWTLYVTDRFLYLDDPATGGTQGRTALVAGVAHHFALSYDGTTIRFYLDGALDGAVVHTVTGVTNDMVIGYNLAQLAFSFGGTLDEIAFHNRALSLSEITTIAAAGGYTPAAATTWDFRGLSALPAGWSRRGVASETFDAAGMSVTYNAGQGHYYTLGTAVSSGTLEVKMVSGPTGGAMSGAILSRASTQGAQLAWYNGPSGALLLGVGSTYAYDGNFVNDGGTPAYPVWLRVRLAGSVAYGSYSLDGSTWASEVSLARASMDPVAQIGFGETLSSGVTSKIEYAKWIP